MRTETMQKIGRYGRPIFWAGLMSLSFAALVKFFKDLFNQEWRETLFTNFSTGVFSIFIWLVLIVVFIISIYKVTHPYVNKDEYDSSNEAWAVGIMILGPLVLAQVLLQQFFDFNLVNFIFPSV